MKNLGHSERTVNKSGTGIRIIKTPCRGIAAARSLTYDDAVLVFDITDRSCATTSSRFRDCSLALEYGAAKVPKVLLSIAVLLDVGTSTGHRLADRVRADAFVMA